MMERNIYKVCTVYISDYTGGLGKGKQFLKIPVSEISSSINYNVGLKTVYSAPFWPEFNNFCLVG